MLDKIQNNNSESIAQNLGIEKIKNLGVSNPIEENKNAFFIDESFISSAAIEKYQRELDINKFSEILNQTDQKEADNMVLKLALEGVVSIEDDNFLFDLINNEDFLNEITK